MIETYPNMYCVQGYRVTPARSGTIMFLLCHNLKWWYQANNSLLASVTFLSIRMLLSFFFVFLSFFSESKPTWTKPNKNLSCGDITFLSVYLNFEFSLLFRDLFAYGEVCCRLVWFTNALACTVMDSRYCQHLRDDMASPSSNLVGLGIWKFLSSIWLADVTWFAPCWMLGALMYQLRQQAQQRL